MIGLPVRLAVCLLVIGLMTPMVADAVREAEEGMSVRELTEEASELRDAIGRAYHGGTGTSVSVRLSLPPGQSLALGGEEPYVIRLMDNGGEVGRVYLDDPVVPVLGEEVLLGGRVTATVSAAVEDGTYGVRVAA